MSICKPILRAKINGYYENCVLDECPYCHGKVVFNRVSDLGTLEKIDNKLVKCLSPKCQKDLKIYGDCINDRFSTLIYDCYDLLKMKMYMYCVLNLCQACEMFFIKAIETKLLSELNSVSDVEIFALSNQLHEDKKFGKFTYRPLLKAFLYLYLNKKTYKSKDEAKLFIKDFSAFQKELEKIGDLKKFIELNSPLGLKELYIALISLDINEIRNNVVHKQGYRPEKQTTEDKIEEVRKVIFALSAKLNVSIFEGELRHN